MRTKILVLGLGCLLLFVFSIKAQEKVKETDLEGEEILFTSILKDADFYPFSSRIGSMYYGWWTLKFENGFIIRVYKKHDSNPVNEIWQAGKKYVAIRNKKKDKLIEVKLLEAEDKEFTPISP